MALVPTMGGLHTGHVSLVELAKAHGRCLVTSIFVNRLQFEPGGDFERYPRTLERDCGMLRAAGCHVVFAPDEREMYPQSQEILVTPPKSADQLCGDHRPGHFQGVVTVVAKLFNMVRPHVAIFGNKDYQQLFVLRHLERQLNFGIRIVGAPTVRESDGLALSSRNAYLTPDERAHAPELFQALKLVKENIEGGKRDYDSMVRWAMEGLYEVGWRVDYVALRNRSGLAIPAMSDRDLIVLGAAWIGRTRLIDNLEIDLP